MVKYLENVLFCFGKSIFTYVIKNWIAISALFISIITLRRNSIKLDVDISDRSDWFLAILLNTGESITNDYGLLHTNIKIINSSNFDIGYFDLKVIDSKNNSILNYYHDKQFHVFNELTDRKAIAFFAEDGASYGLNLPTGTYGIIKAHSITSVDIVVSPEVETTELFVLFKTTKRKLKLFKPKQGFVNTPFEQFSQSVQVTQSLKPDYEKLLSDLKNE